MQIVIGALHEQFAIHHAAQSDADGRQFGREHLGIADHRGVGSQTGRTGLHVLFDMLAAGFLFAFDEELHVHGQFAVAAQQALHGLDLQIDLAFVVGCAAREDVAAPHLRLEGRRFPLIERIGRLHIVVAVEQDGRLARRAQPFGVDQRVALAFDQLGRKSGGLQLARGQNRRRGGYRACARRAC